METDDNLSTSSLFVIMDTNAIIQSLTNPVIKEKILEFLKGKKCQIVICTEVFAELVKPKKPSVGRWPGFTKNIVLEKITQHFGERIQDYPTNEIERLNSAKLEKKHTSDGLHFPDSILLSIAKNNLNSVIISGDDALIRCCKSENIQYFDQNLFIPKTPEIIEKNSNDILSKLNTDFSPKEIENDVIWLFEDLYKKWKVLDSWNKNGVHLFQQELRKIISTLKFHDKMFERLEKYPIDSIFMDNFFDQISKGIKSYEELINLLKTKQELKHQNIKDLQDLLEK